MKKPQILYLLLVFTFLLTLNSFSFKSLEEINKETIIGKVVAITDGDTFKLLKEDSTLIRVRVANIDCPERKQPFSKRAKQFTSDAIFGKSVTLEVLKKDRYRRLISNVIYDDTLILSQELIKKGLAWHYLKYSKDSLLQSLHDTAKANKIGLWQDENVIAPWDWRDVKKRKVKQ